MKTGILFILSFLSSFAWSQHQIADTDTTLDYQSRFYKNGVLDLNGYYVYALDSTSYFSYDTTRYYDFTKSDFNLDSSSMYRLVHGKWIFHYDQKKQHFFSLEEYDGGILIGKKYDFREDGTLFSTFKRYPRIKDSIFNGSQIIYYDQKGQHITWIEYILFLEDESDHLFWNTSYYSKDGKLTSYSHYDEKNDTHCFIEYNKKGEIKSSFVKNTTEWAKKKWNTRRTKLKVSERINDQLFKRVYRKGKLVREKIITN